LDGFSFSSRSLGRFLLDDVDFFLCDELNDVDSFLCDELYFAEIFADSCASGSCLSLGFCFVTGGESRFLSSLKNLGNKNAIFIFKFFE
jgi:hypothetical protein